MAKQQHLDVLKLGVEKWNQWRDEYLDIKPDLSEANLNSFNLKGVNFSGANLIRIKLGEADLSGANLNRVNLAGSYAIKVDLSSADLGAAYLCDANMPGANLSYTNLSDANLSGSNLMNARLSQADLSRANLIGAVLSGSNLSGSDLKGADLSRASLVEADLSGAQIGWTICGDVDLGKAKGLDSLKYLGPSTIGIDTIYRSGGSISEVFLRNTGVPASFLEVMRALVNQPIDYYTCFISYSSKDQDFVESLHADLQSKGVRCWFAPEDMKIGDKIRPRIDENIRLCEKLLLILSQHSIESVWVEKEVETAFEKERYGKEHGKKQTVLFPIRLDETIMQTSEAWAADVRRTRLIGDFSKWKNHDDYQKAFARLLRDLKADFS